MFRIVIIIVIGVIIVTTIVVVICCSHDDIRSVTVVISPSRGCSFPCPGHATTMLGLGVNPTITIIIIFIIIILVGNKFDVRTMSPKKSSISFRVGGGKDLSGKDEVVMQLKIGHRCWGG
jgi:hypothetical protein